VHLAAGGEEDDLARRLGGLEPVGALGDEVVARLFGAQRRQVLARERKQRRALDLERRRPGTAAAVAPTARLSIPM